MRRREGWVGWLFTAPAFVHLLVFALLPIAYAFYLSLFKANLLKDQKAFVGLNNYSFAFGEETFWNALWNSAKYAVFSVPFGLAVALGVALLVNQKLKGVTIFRTLYYIPAITSGVALAMLWIYVYLPEVGAINTMLGWVGIENKTDFLNNASWAMPALIFMSAWTGLGPRMVLFLAGLVGISPSLYEAADLDGASRWKQFWAITLPMLAPTTFFVAVTSTISAFQVFTPVYMMTKGGPDGATDVVGYHIYTEAWVNFHTGLAAAKSFVLLAAIVVVSLFQFRLMRAQMRGYSAA
ncbi:MAG: sugar ABC transporter permease [Fimbriimonadales bacterium]